MVGVILTVLSALGSYILYRRAKSAACIQQDIEQLSKRLDLDDEDLRREAHSSKSAQSASPEVVDRYVDRTLVDESQRRKEAEEELLQHVPPSPRGAKRMVNHLRLFLYVATKRKLFGGTPDLHPRHLGKWVALREQWPELGWSVNNNPGVLRLLEESVDEADLEAVLKEHAPTVKPSEEMLAFLSNEPALAPIAERLVYFRSAT